MWPFLRLAGLNIVFYFLFAGLTLLYIFPVTPLMYFWLRYAKKKNAALAARLVIWAYGHYWSRILRLCQKVTLEGLEHVPDTACLVAANHQSFFDPYCFGLLPMENITFAVRSWPFRIPFYAPLMYKAGYLNAETLGAEEFLLGGEKLLRSGAFLAVFPEGTRSRDGSLGRFRAGAFELSARCDIPVVPMCISGTGTMLPPGSFVIRPAYVRITLLPPVSAPAGPDGRPDARALRKLVKEMIASCLAGTAPAHGSTVGC